MWHTPPDKHASSAILLNTLLFREDPLESLKRRYVWKMVTCIVADYH